MEFIAEKYLQSNGVICIETPNNNGIIDILIGNRIKDYRFYKELYPPTHVVGFSAKTFKYMSNYEIVYSTTYGHNDSMWYFDVDRKKEHPLVNYILTKLSLNTNIFVIMKRVY